MNKMSEDSVRVYARVRGDGDAIQSTDDTVSIIHPVTKKTVRQAFDGVFSSEATQQAVFDRVAAPLIEDVLNGYNSTLLAYGQTGSGKTYTMLGTADQPGIISQACHRLFRPDVRIECSCVQIYMEKLTDLLSPHQVVPLKLREQNKRVFLQGCTVKPVASPDELLSLTRIASDNRAIASTQMNQQSSRSHCVFIFHVISPHHTGKLMLVDLAGSEMVSKSGVTGLNLKEAQKINRSLSTLSLVIYALTDDKQSHVPYRDSLLTRLLSDSLGGTAKTSMVLTLSADPRSASQTLSTLQFGARAKRLKCHAVRNEISLTLDDYRKKCEEQALELTGLRKEIGQLRDELSRLPASTGGTGVVLTTHTHSVSVSQDFVIFGADHQFQLNDF